jgi:peptide/nickel transport system ATP-binding protein
MIFQDPLSSLHPYYTVGWQIEEMLEAHGAMHGDAARRRAIELLGLVGIPRAAERVDQFPHQFSGGMRQRAMIAMAIALDPKLLVADEPTTALDVTVQAQIIALLRRLQREMGTAIIMITHDLGVIAEMADDVVVMYAGRVMERAPARALYHTPHHPYTVGLLGSIPRGTAADQPLVAIPGQPPSPLSPPPGCPFHPRCPFVMPRCVSETPPLRAVNDSETNAHDSACWLPTDLVGTSDEVQRARATFADAARVEQAV